MGGSNRDAELGTPALHLVAAVCVLLRTHVAESELRLAALHSGARLLARGTWIMEHRFLFGCLHPAVACAGADCGPR